MVLYLQEGCVVCDLVEKALASLDISVPKVKVPSAVVVKTLPAFPALYLENTLYIGEGIVSVLKKEFSKNE